MPRLIARADDPFTQIYVIDGNFARVAKGTGSLRGDFPPGLYSVKFKAGSTVIEKPVALELGSRPQTVVAPPLAFASAAPVARTRTTREFHVAPARTLSRRPHMKIGSGSELFVMVRSLSEDAREDTAAGLTLRDINGGELVQYSTEGERNKQQRWAACNVEVDPGEYRLRVTSGRNSYEMCVVCSPGWQTQVFLGQTKYEPPRSRPRADLANASVFMCRPGKGFQSDRFRSTDIARLALADERTIIPPKRLQDLIRGKFENPMLGVYAAHLLVRQVDSHRELLQIVMENTRVMLGDHPDVLAVIAWLEGRVRRRVQFPVPPMLLDSYRLIVDKSASNRRLVPERSLFASVVDGIRSVGPWLVWRTPTESATVVGPADLRHIKRTLGRGQSERALAKTVQTHHLSNLEAAVLRKIRDTPLTSSRGARAAGGQRATGLRATQGTVPVTGTTITALGGRKESRTRTGFDAGSFYDRTARDLGVPYSTIEIAAGRLAKKLAP